VILRTGGPPTPDWHESLQLQGYGLTLTPLAAADANDLLTALGPPEESAEVVAHLTFGPPPDVAAATKIIEAAVDDRDRIAYGQRLSSTGELVGSTSFYEINPSLRSLAIGHTWVARPHWRTFVNTASKLIMLERAFEGLGAERVVWHTDIRNTRSQDAIARLGATREGVLRHHRIRVDGSWRDTVQYSMLSEEWPAAKARLTASLQRYSASTEAGSA
jgi:RimJ/RimL family protein N-acetyltransferase